MQVDFLFDFSSPNAYLAHRLIPGIEARTGVTFTYVPCLLGGIFNATNNKSPMETNAHVENKIKYDWLEFERFLNKHKLTEFSFNPNFPLRTVFLMRAAIVVSNTGDLRKFVDAGMTLAWEDQINVSDPAIAAAALTEAGFDGAALLEATKDDAIKAQLFDSTNAAVARGAFGMPTFYVEDDIYFGKDRLRDVEEDIMSRLG
ncbi:MAG: 2-hydroxychromene-2-carboxylate isomerase [Planktotalea sp.]|uniref:2-hydroxychromene-2-carboxylate isomerase n=1 Tax=Planktotalea sp. TaxID=2029877 RepID=UPI003C7917FC